MTNLPTILIAGPYATNFSLAKVNRGLALGLQQTSKKYGVQIWKEPSFAIDKVATAEDLKKLPWLKEMLTNDISDIDTIIVDSYPKSPQDPYGFAACPGKTKLLNIAWEETVFPEDKVQEINEHLHGVLAATSHTKEMLSRNGVRVPIEIVPIGFAPEFMSHTPREYALDTKKSFKFLHISTARMRKGVDVLLKAYFEEFSGRDDVVLVIKSFPNPDNLVNELLSELTGQFDNPPEVLHISDPNLSEEELIDLTASADCTVYPTRAEGFGMPIAESMFLNVPTIVTGYSSHMDFCDEHNCLLIDFEIQDAIQSEHVHLGAKWAEPDKDHLKKLMRHAFENKDSEGMKEMVRLAHQSAKRLTWENAAKLTEDFVAAISTTRELKHKTIAVLSPINSISGISEYSRDLYTSIESSFKEFYYLANTDVADRARPDEPNVLRLWEYGEQEFEGVLQWIVENTPDILHIQLHPAEISPQVIAALITKLQKLSNPPSIHLTAHAVQAAGIDLAGIAGDLKTISQLHLHKEQDFKYMQSQGLTNITLFPLPYDDYPIFSKKRLRERLGILAGHPILVTHGLVSYHKGLLETATAVGELVKEYPHLLWLAVNAVNINNSSSADTFEQLRAKVQELGIEDNVRFFPEFIAEPLQILALLQTADIGLLMYSEVGESASAAVRKFLAAGIPNIVTDIPMMSELTKEVYKIPDNSPKNIVSGVKKLVEHPQLQREIIRAALETSRANNWNQMALRLLQVYSHGN
jgi:glycosyltransferase involved in cell wall biosynthesis